MKRTCLWLFVWLFSLPAVADVTGRVIAVTDGDSLRIRINRQEEIRVRLLGIAAPNPYQDFAKQAQSNLAAYTLGKDVRIDSLHRDGRGWALARVWAAESNCVRPDCPKTVDVGLAQLAAGLAWHDPQYEKEMPPADQQRYGEAELMAKLRRQGLWSGKNPSPPWAWRNRRLEE